MRRRPRLWWWDDAVDAAVLMREADGVKRRVYLDKRTGKWAIGSALLRSVPEVPC